MSLLRSKIALVFGIASDMASRTTGEVLFVDSGYNSLGLKIPENQYKP